MSATGLSTNSTPQAAIPTARRSIFHRIQDAWTRWITPRSSDREQAFIERTLRGLLPFLLIGLSFMSFYSLISGSSAVSSPAYALFEFIISNVMLIGAMLMLVRGKIGIAAMLTVGRILLALITLINITGYWNGPTVPISILIVLLGSLVLSRRNLLILTLATASIVVVVAILQTNAGHPIPFFDGEPISTPFSVAISLGFTLLLIVRYAIYQRNEFAARVKEVNDLVTTLEQRVAERTHELQIAKAEAEVARDLALDADRLKSQFLASMSHELRTPLNAILTFTELMSMGTFGDVNDEQKNYLDKTLSSGKHLLSLINDVLDISKIQSGMIKMFIEQGFMVEPEIKAITATARQLLGSKPVEMILDIEPDLPPMACDKRRVRQILLNLISNAVKFTEKGSITVRARREGDYILFAVIDTGPGIPHDQQDIIFEPFIQTETGIQHAGGTGLGLPISRKLAEAHGGKVWVESAVGHGASFFVKLPVQAESAA